MAESDSAMCAQNINRKEEGLRDFWTASASLPNVQEKVARMVKDSVDRGEPNRELSTAGKYLLLAAMNLCAETVRNFSGYLEHTQSDEAEYWVLDAKRTMSQTHRVLDVLAEIEGLDMP